MKKHKKIYTIIYAFLLLILIFFWTATIVLLNNWLKLSLIVVLNIFVWPVVTLTLAYIVMLIMFIMQYYRAKIINKKVKKIAIAIVSFLIAISLITATYRTHIWKYQNSNFDVGLSEYTNITDAIVYDDFEYSTIDGIGKKTEFWIWNKTFLNVNRENNVEYKISGIINCNAVEKAVFWNYYSHKVVRVNEKISSNVECYYFYQDLLPKVQYFTLIAKSEKSIIFVDIMIENIQDSKPIEFNSEKAVDYFIAKTENGFEIKDKTQKERGTVQHLNHSA